MPKWRRGGWMWYDESTWGRSVSARNEWPEGPVPWKRTEFVFCFEGHGCYLGSSLHCTCLHLTKNIIHNIVFSILSLWMKESRSLFWWISVFICPVCKSDMIHHCLSLLHHQLSRRRLWRLHDWWSIAVTESERREWLRTNISEKMIDERGYVSMPN